MNVDLSITYVYVINSDLKMSKGKIAAQVSHVAMMLTEYDFPIGRAIVLKAEEKLLRELIQRPEVKYVKDAGLTEVPEGSLTCVGFVQNSEFKEITRKLKLV